jgi:RNA polymerase sigma-70 factor, ECF subfamily
VNLLLFDDPDANAAIAASVIDVRGRWPKIQVSDAAFGAFLAQRRSSSGLEPALAIKHAADLYLACACASGDPAAMLLFEQLYFADEIDGPCRRSGAIAPEEMRQRVRAKLFVGPEPKILQYAGRSSLRTWLRAVVGRLVIDAARERPRDLPTPEKAFADLAHGGGDPDQLLSKHVYQEALEAAFSDAAARLSPRDKNLLRYGLGEGLNIDQIGRIYGVHRVTAARWLQKARAAFVAEMEALVKARLKMSNTEFESVLRLVLSQIDVTIARVFSEAPSTSSHQ